MFSIANPTGRFAPTPSGHLHFGSLLAAVASFLDIKAQSGQWKLRIEDIDTPRVVPGSIDSILNTLDAFHLHWDGDVHYSSQHKTAYLDALEDLKTTGHVFGCDCSRKQVFERHPDGIYQGFCRNREVAHPRAWRFKTPSGSAQLNDAIQPSEWIDLDECIGDFVIWRADQLPAYALTSVVDDALQGVTHVVRGQDLYHATLAQDLVLQALGYPNKQYAHIPLATNDHAIKLSKRTHAPALNHLHPQTELLSAFEFLGLPIQAELQEAGVEELWTWALTQWSLERVPKKSEIIHKID